jgi:hypothetical protein
MTNNTHQSSQSYSQHNSYLYIWLINNQLYYYRLFTKNKKGEQITTTINYNNDTYDIELIPKYTHNDYVNNTIITYCDFKFLSKNGKELLYMDSFTYQECSLGNCIREFNKMENSNDIGLSFTFKIKSKYAFYHISNSFSNVIKYISFDNNRYIIKVQHEDALITCYYYCFVRYYLESSMMLKQYNLQRNSFSEVVKYYFQGSSSLFGRFVETLLNPFMYDYNNNDLDVEITLKTLGTINEGNITDNKNELETTYNEFHNSIIKHLADYIFNKNSIRPLYIDDNENCSYVDKRTNIYCNPFNVLYYHLCVINTFILDSKSKIIKSMSSETSKKIYNLINSQLNCMNLYDFNTQLYYNISAGRATNTTENISQDTLINLITINYFYKYFDIEEILNEHDSYEYELVDCNEFIKLFNNINLILSYDYETFDDKISCIANHISELGVFEYSAYEKFKNYYLTGLIIRKINTFPSCNILTEYLLSIYSNYGLYNNEDKSIVNNCITECMRIIMDIEIDNITPPQRIIEILKELSNEYDVGLYEAETINKLYTELYEELKKYEYNTEFREIMEIINLADELNNETEFEKINNTNNSENKTINNKLNSISESNIDELIHNRQRQETQRHYYISSWLGI